MIRATICRPRELGDAELAQWHDMQRRTPALCHPFLSAEFAQSVDAVSDRARVAVLEDGSHLAGFFAYEHRAPRVARPLAGRVAYRQALIHAPDAFLPWPEVLRATGLRVAEFTDLTAAQLPRGDAIAVSQSPIVDTSGGWDAYRDAARKRRRLKNTMYLARRLEREAGSVEFNWGVLDAAELRQLIDWKSAQYRRSGWPNPFARRWVRELVDIVSAPRGNLKPLFSSLRAGGKLVAVDLSLVFEDVYAGWFSAYNPEYSFYSPGAIRMLRTVEYACNDGYSYIDLARGDETYKRSFKNAFIDVGTGFVHAPSFIALGYRSVRAPTRAARAYVLDRPRVRSFVRSSLRRFGAAREALPLLH
jgi:CelD/BcsL family acetyltransferase involved in cellulose biosynthesis